MEERTRSSIYATAQTVIWPWTDPGVAASARSRKGKGGGRGRPAGIDLPWLLSGANTVYLCSPIEDQKRLAPAFGGLLNDLINQAYRHVAATGLPLDPPLLVVIDEAGNTPLRSLPEYASTLAGIGVLLVTIWQSLAQTRGRLRQGSRHDPHEPPDQGVLRGPVGSDVASLHRPHARRGRGRHPVALGEPTSRRRLGPVLDDPGAARPSPRVASDAPR
jgi:hypothetical protein